jgi:c-di-GMP-binding flagellar brake protein YcgR
MVRPLPPPPPKAAGAAPSARQRQFRRLAIRMSAEVRTSKTVFTATTRDLSEGGAGIVSDRPLRDGDEIALGLFLVVDDVEEQMPPLWVKGRVVWSSELEKSSYMTGVRFDVISPQQKVWLNQILTQLGPHEPAAGPKR